MTLRKFALTVGLAIAAFIATGAAAYAATAYATSGVNVRSGPGTHYRVVDQLHRGEAVEVLGCRGSWCRIEQRGPDGWVSANYLTYGGRNYDDRYDDYYYNDHRYRPRPRHRGYFYDGYRSPRPHASFCLGGQNASFCINGY